MTTLVGALAAPLLIFAMALPSHAESTCKDGTTSAATGRGACSGHGGVKKAGKPAAAAATAGNTDPTGATAKCKDGSYSKSKTHKGSCSHHGGVAEFIAQ
jgi:hypothetical protein